MIGLRFPELKSLSLAITRRIQQVNKHCICDGVEKLPEWWKWAIQVQKEYIERM